MQTDESETKLSRSFALFHVAGIDRLIREGNYPKVADLTVALGCSVSEIKRDILFMREKLHAPILTRCATWGSGYYYARGWNARRAVLRYLGFGD